MRLSSRTDYAVHALFDLAFHCQGRAVQAKEVAHRQGIPLRYLEQILQDLRRAKIIGAKRGPHGGYLLARAAAEVRLSDIVTAVDRPPRDLFALDESRQGANRGTDVPGLVWSELAQQASALFDQVTLADLVARAEGLGVPRLSPTVAAQMYFI